MPKSGFRTIWPGHRRSNCLSCRHLLQRSRDDGVPGRATVDAASVFSPVGGCQGR